MAKASVTLTCQKCGQEFKAEKRDFRNRADADRWEALMVNRGGLCRECWSVERKQAREAETEKQHAQEFAEAQDWEVKVGILPALEGSEAQIAWATTIRYNILLHTIGGDGLKPDFFMANWEKLVSDGGHGEDTINAVAHIRSWALPLIKQKSAKWWIDNREVKGMGAQYIITNWGDIYNASLVQAAKDEKITEIKNRKPVMPECLKKAFASSSEDATWNMKVYGTAKYKNLRIYIGGNEFPLTNDEMIELVNYIKAKDAWEKELKGLQK